MAGCAGNPRGLPVSLVPDFHPRAVRRHFPAWKPEATAPKKITKESVMTSHAQRASAPVAFQFQQSYTVRVIVIQGEPWFCLRDAETDCMWIEDCLLSREMGKFR